MAYLSAAMNWLGFGRGEAKQARAYSRFNYSPELIGKLKGDHAELLKMYKEVEAMAVQGRFANIAAALAAFKSKFDVHILEENLHFYCYIEEKLSGRAEDQALIRSFRAEMNAIARGVVNFVKKYRMAGVRVSNGQEFLAELRQVGALLVQRIGREEQDLYTLYRP